MSREILFRGKRIDNGEWMEGYVSKYFDGFKTATCIAWPTRETITGSLCYDVDPATVGQYTGLTNKNGKKIFEGDVMEFDAYGLHYKGKVFFDEGAFCVTCNHPTASTFLIIALYHDAICVGNIYDNPELMEGELND